MEQEIAKLDERSLKEIKEYIDEKGQERSAAIRQVPFTPCFDLSELPSDVYFVLTTYQHRKELWFCLGKTGYDIREWRIERICSLKYWEF